MVGYTPVYHGRMANLIVRQVQTAFAPYRNHSR
jgi:hypothetical protein